MSKEQVFQDSLIAFRDKIALAISIDFEDGYGPDWIKCDEIFYARPKGFEKSKIYDLKTWDLTQLLSLLWSKTMSFNENKFGKKSHVSFLKVIKAYRNEWAHQQPLDLFEIYRAIDLMILTLELLGYQSDELKLNRIILAKEIAKLDDQGEERKEEKKIAKKENENCWKVNEEKKTQKETRDEGKKDEKIVQKEVEEQKIEKVNQDSINLPPQNIQASPIEVKNEDAMDIELPNVSARREINKDSKENAEIPAHLRIETLNFPRLPSSNEERKNSPNKIAGPVSSKPISENFQAPKNSELRSPIPDKFDKNAQPQDCNKIEKEQEASFMQSPEKEQIDKNNLPKYYPQPNAFALLNNSQLPQTENQKHLAYTEKAQAIIEPSREENLRQNVYIGNTQMNQGFYPPKNNEIAKDIPRVPLPNMGFQTKPDIPVFKQNPLLQQNLNLNQPQYSQNQYYVPPPIPQSTNNQIQSKLDIPAFKQKPLFPQNLNQNQPQYPQNQFNLPPPIPQNTNNQKPSNSQYQPVPYNFPSQFQQIPNFNPQPPIAPSEKINSSYQNYPQYNTKDRPNLSYQRNSYEIPSQSLQIGGFYSQPPLTPLDKTKNPYANPPQNISQTLNIDSYLPRCVNCTQSIEDDLYFEHSSSCKNSICLKCISKFAKKAKLVNCPCCREPLSRSELDYLDYIASLNN